MSQGTLLLPKFHRAVHPLPISPSRVTVEIMYVPSLTVSPPACFTRPRNRWHSVLELIPSVQTWASCTHRHRSGGESSRYWSVLAPLALFCTISSNRSKRSYLEFFLLFPPSLNVSQRWAWQLLVYHSAQAFLTNIVMMLLLKIRPTIWTINYYTLSLYCALDSFSDRSFAVNIVGKMIL